MTGKRFTQKDESIINTQTDELVNASSEESAKIIISWLNELFDKNAELMKENYGLLDGLAYKDEVEIPKLSEKISDLECENEQLKKQNKELKQDNDIKFWKLQLIEQWNNTELISHELYLAIENGYEISDEFKKHLDGLKKKHEEHMKKAERLGI